MAGMTLAPVALVTTAWLASSSTCADANAVAGHRHADVVSAFLLYHTSIGVAKTFVFFDGDRDSQLDVTELHPHVQALCRAGRVAFYYRSKNKSDAEATEQRSRYERCANWSRLGGSADHDVASRQMLNAEVAMQLCLEHNRAHTQSSQQHQRATADPSDPFTCIGELRWLLHLDIDELLYLDAFASDLRANALAALVAQLEAQHVQQLTIANSEAVPTHVYGRNYFASTTTFKRHPTRVPLTSAAQRKLAFWQERTAHAQFFLFYDNGKSLVRVQADVAPASAHHWHALSSSTSSSSVLVGTKTNFYDARQNVAPQDVLLEPERSRTSVLHFAVCGLEWLEEKYARLGRFPDVWGGRGPTDRAIPIAPCFHTQARDISSSSGGSGLETLYRSHVMLDASSREWHEQVAAGVCDVICFPQELLATFGLTDDRHESECEDAAQREDSGLDTTTAPVVSRAVTKDAPAPFAVEKAWMLASISQQYL